MKGKRVGHIADAVSISERPASVEDRAMPGHWEGDLLYGSKNSFIIAASAWKPTSPSISAIRKALGSADQTKTPTGFCDSTFPEEPTLLRTRKHNSIQWRASSTSGREKRWTSIRQQRDSTIVLRRPVETTRVISYSESDRGI